jgi:hypothetical protein
MAIPWFTVLKSVPWSTVIGNAPVIADGAKKLWKAVAKKPAPLAPPPAREPVAAQTGEQTVAALQARLAAVESAASRLEEQMLASSELIKALADQNAVLIGLVEAHRVRSRWLARAVGVLAVAFAAGLVVLLVRLNAG